MNDSQARPLQAFSGREADQMSKQLIQRGRRGLRVACALTALGAVAGCASPPAYTAVNHQRVVPLATGDVWRRLHAFLQDEGMAVVSEDAAAGIIDAHQAEVGKGVLAAYADCGREPSLLHPMQRQTVDLTILVKPAPDGSQVTANAAFSQTLKSRGAGSLTVACGSKGVLEAAVLNVASGQPMEAAVIPQ
jgi:hypothetical protein